MIKYILITFLSGLIIADYNPVKNWVTEYTGKSPYEWGFIAGQKTRKILYNEK